MIVTVTLNAAIDRTLLVPNFQLGQRHRASVGFASAGGKGINVARALKRLGTPVVCTGLAGGRTGTLLVEDLTSEGILNDFVRIRGESRTSTAVLDPTSNAYTEINEWGPEVGDEELDMLSDKLSYLTQSAEFVVFSGSLPRDVQPDVYAGLIREANRRHLLTVLDAEGEALRLGIKAEPYLVTPNMREAESLVGREFVDDADLASGLDEIAALGARNVIITLETGCYALLREDGPRSACARPRRRSSRSRGSAPATRSSPASSRRERRASRSTTRSRSPSGPGRPRFSRPAPGASTPRGESPGRSRHRRPPRPRGPGGLGQTSHQRGPAPPFDGS